MRRNNSAVMTSSDQAPVTARLNRALRVAAQRRREDLVLAEDGDGQPPRRRLRVRERRQHPDDHRQKQQHRQVGLSFLEGSGVRGGSHLQGRGDQSASGTPATSTLD